MMSKTMHILLSHELTNEQIDDARAHLGITEFKTMPEELRNIWKSIPPDMDQVSSVLNEIKEWLKQNASEGDIVFIQGEFGATYHMVDFAFMNKITPVYATTERIVVEKTNPNGEIIFERMFKHVRFRKYERCRDA